MTERLDSQSPADKERASVEDMFLAACTAKQRGSCTHGGITAAARCHQCTVETAVDILSARSAGTRTSNIKLPAVRWGTDVRDRDEMIVARCECVADANEIVALLNGCAQSAIRSIRTTVLSARCRTRGACTYGTA